LRPKVKNRPIGEKSPNLVTLLLSVIRPWPSLDICFPKLILSDFRHRKAVSDDEPRLGIDQLNWIFTLPSKCLHGAAIWCRRTKCRKTKCLKSNFNCKIHLAPPYSPLGLGAASGVRCPRRG
jgi:hypothetical protein